MQADKREYKGAAAARRIRLVLRRGSGGLWRGIAYLVSVLHKSWRIAHIIS